MKITGPKALWICITAGAVAGATYLLVSQEPDANRRFSGGAFDGHANAVLLQNAPAVHIPPPRFSGGELDGVSACRILVNPDLPSSASPRFAGGSFDGAFCLPFLQNEQPPYTPSPRFSGHHYDGYALALYLAGSIPPETGSERFSGGIYDGYSVATLLGLGGPGADASLRYSGGSFDGSAFALFSPSGSIGGLSPRFGGGAFSGYDSSALFGLAIQPLLDTDGDGVPDWWELRWYPGLTNTDGRADGDLDGMPTFDEFIADTDPTDGRSFFRIAGVTTTPSGISVTLHSSSARVYRLDATTDVRAGAWTPVTDTPTPGDVSGTTTLIHSNPPASSAYRAVVAFPE